MAASFAPALGAGFKGPTLPGAREISDFLDARVGAVLDVDASYGDSLRALLPRRLADLVKARWRV